MMHSILSIITIRLLSSLCQFGDALKIIHTYVIRKIIIRPGQGIYNFISDGIVYSYYNVFAIIAVTKIVASYNIMYVQSHFVGGWGNKNNITLMWLISRNTHTHTHTHKYLSSRLRTTDIHGNGIVVCGDDGDELPIYSSEEDTTYERYTSTRT